MLKILGVLNYVANTVNVGIEYKAGPSQFKSIAGDAPIVGFCDADFAMCKDTRKSVSGGIIYYRGCPVQ